MKSGVKAEILKIQKAGGGMVDPADIVAFARNPKTALHGCFCWDNTKAAEEYRLWQARQILRVHVVMLPEAPNTPVRAWVSLSADRRSGGYRSIHDVMSDEGMRGDMLATALRDARVFEQKYAMLSELAEVFGAIRKVRKKVKGRKQLV